MGEGKRRCHSASRYKGAGGVHKGHFRIPGFFLVLSDIFGFWFLVCYAATQLATHIPQRRIQVYVCVCVLLCFVDPILGKSRSRCHSLNQGTWGGRILTLHLNYVAGYSVALFLLTRG